MGFKTITDIELKTNIGINYIGIPLKHISEIEDVRRIDIKSLKSRKKFSEIMIRDKEYVDYQFLYDGEIKSIDGYGNISIENNSLRDRVWDSSFQITGTPYCSLESENNVNLGIFEPNTGRNIKYNLTNVDELPEIIKINEFIEIFHDNSTPKENISSLDQASFKENKKRNLLLHIGEENLVQFSIHVENTSPSTISDLKLNKMLFKDFSDLQFNTKSQKEIKSSNNNIEWTIDNIRPGEHKELTIVAKISPKRNITIRTGKIDLSFNLEDSLISGIDIHDFKGYSHAMHTINKVESREKPGNWHCNLNFENHSTFLLQLNSIVVMDKTQSESVLDLDFSSIQMIIPPEKSYTSESWDVIETRDPKFTRKIDYCISSQIIKQSLVSMQVQDDVFQVIGLLFDEEISKKEIKSFEEIIIDNKINIKNIGNVPIYGILIREMIPEDFLPDTDLLNYKFVNSSGEIDRKDITLKIDPPDNDSTKKHVLELKINCDVSLQKNVVNIDDFLEFTIPIKSITPDHEKEYKFPTEIESNFLKYKSQNYSDFYIKKDIVSHENQLSVNVVHERRNLSIGKEIFAGRSEEEFAINVFVKNNSNVKINDVDIVDSFPQSFEFTSANIGYDLTKNDAKNTNTISFTIDTLHPYQEAEVIYYLKNISGKDVSFSELESYFYG